MALEILNNIGRGTLSFLSTALIFSFLVASATCYGNYDENCIYESSIEQWSDGCVDNDFCACCENFFVYDDVHGFVQFATNERYHGISYTHNKMCLQGYLVWNEPETGIYVNLYSESNSSPGTDVFFLPGIGIAKKQWDFTFDLKARYWIFPGNDATRRLDFFECIGSVSYAFQNAVVTAGLSYSPQYYFTRYTELYPYINVVVKLPCRFSLSAEYGYEYVKNWKIVGFNSHDVYDISLTRDCKGFYVGLRYVATNIKGRNDIAGLAKPVFIGFLGKAF